LKGVDPRFDAFQIAPRDLARPVQRRDVRPALPERPGHRNAEFVGVFRDRHDDVVAGLDPRAPVDEHLGVFAYAFVHTVRVSTRE